MSTEPYQPRSLGAVMSSESGFEPEADGSSFRISGFISVILALVGGFAIVAWPMVGFCIAAVGFGLFALRKSVGNIKPTGTTAGKIGIVLGLLFGSCGISRPVSYQHTLGGQAEHFAREFVKLASTGNTVYTSELQKSYVNRYPLTVPLIQRYEQDRLSRLKAAEEQEGSGPPAGMDEDESTVPDLSKYAPDHEWILAQPVRVYTKYGRLQATVILAADRSEKPYQLNVTMEHLFHKERGTSEWHVDGCMPHRERIVAPMTL